MSGGLLLVVLHNPPTAPPTALELGAMRFNPEIHTFLLRVMQEDLHFDLKTDLVPLVETKEYALRGPYDPSRPHLAEQLPRYDASVLGPPSWTSRETTCSPSSSPLATS